MKKIVALILALIMCVLLCGCFKSEEVKSVEMQIAALNENSTYREINEVYKAYINLDSKKLDKVENADVLAKYCEVPGGNFTLSVAMEEEIVGYFDDYAGVAGTSYVAYLIRYDFGIKQYTRDWMDWSDIVVASAEKTDAYTIMGKGTIMIQDEYGKWSEYHFEITLGYEYSEEEECGYELDYNVRYIG